jgi:hypothetical protein
MVESVKLYFSGFCANQRSPLLKLALIFDPRYYLPCRKCPCLFEFVGRAYLDVIDSPAVLFFLFLYLMHPGPYLAREINC